MELLFHSPFWHVYGIAGEKVSTKPIVFSSPSREMEWEKKIRDDYMRHYRRWKKWMISIDISKSRWRILISKKIGMRMNRAISGWWWFFAHGMKNTWRIWADEALYENICEIEFCDWISVSLISAALRKVSQCLPLLHLRRLRRDLESGSKSVLYSFTRKQNPRFAKRQIGGFHLCTHESEFHSKQSYSIEDTEDGDAGICEDGDPHIGIA